MLDDPEIFRNALIKLYGPIGYVDKFSSKIGRRRQTVYRWLRGDTPIPKWAKQVLGFMLRSKDD